MIYKSGKIGYYKSYEYAKSMLSKMGNIIAFKGFGIEDHDYYEVIDNIRNYYNLILFDDKLNEYWFDTTCGCKGIGAIYSEKILQLVGIRENYKLFEGKEIYKYDLNVNNDMNLLVIELECLKNVEKYFINSLIRLKFKNAYLRYKSIDALQSFGSVKSINDAIGGELYQKYFDSSFLEEKVYGEYTINNVLFLDGNLGKDIKININDKIKETLSEANSIFIKDIKKMEYGIYGY